MEPTRYVVWGEWEGDVPEAITSLDALSVFPACAWANSAVLGELSGATPFRAWVVAVTDDGTQTVYSTYREQAEVVEAQVSGIDRERLARLVC